MEAKLLDIKPLKNGGWLVTVEISTFVWRRLRFVTTARQFFTNDNYLNYRTDWYNADDAIQIVDPLRQELCRVTQAYDEDKKRQQRLLSLDIQVISEGEKRIPIK